MTNNQLKDALNKILLKKEIIEERDKYKKPIKYNYSEKPKVSFYINKNDKKFIDNISKTYGITQTQFINKAVNLFIDRIEELEII